MIETMLISGEMTTVGSQASRANIDTLAKPNNLNGLEANNDREPAANRESAPDQAAPRLSRDEGSTVTVSDEGRALAGSASETANEASSNEAVAESRQQASEATQPTAAQPDVRDNRDLPAESRQALDTFSQIASFGDNDRDNVSFSAFA